MKEKTPQEKKALSYAKDRRNSYRENDKASRRLIPKRKAGVNRVYRRTVSDTLAMIGPAVDLEQAEIFADRALAIKRGDWKGSRLSTR